MDIYNLLETQCCRIGFRARTKAEMLRELAELAVQSAHLHADRREEIFIALEKREAEGSTGFGNGIAIPHAQLPNLDRFILAIGIHEDGVEFQALDKKKVKVFVLILGPEGAVAEHLKILTAVSRALSKTNAKKEMLGSHSGEAVFESFLRNLEKLGAAQGERPTMKLFVLVLYLEEFLYDILEIFIEKGIEGATVIDSVGMGEYISNVPIFASFINFLNEKKNHSKTILAMLPEKMEDELIEAIEHVLGDLDKTQGAAVFTLPISKYKGDMQIV